MPLSLSYPGVYMEELPSGSHTITGVSTSVTAFVGRCLKGPVDEPVVINSFADFERMFGGLWLQSKLGFAVSDFFLNGGSQAVIVRVINGASKAQINNLATSSLDLEAVNEGAWANSLSVRVTYNTPDEVASRYGLTSDKFFSLTILDGVAGSKTAVETLSHLTLEESGRRIDKVLANESNYIRVTNAAGMGTTRPAETTPAANEGTVLTGGSDGSVLNNTAIIGNENNKTGLYALAKADIFNLLCIPPFYADGTSATDIISAINPVITAALAYCKKRHAFLIVDGLPSWQSPADVTTGSSSINTLLPSKQNAEYGAIYFPYVQRPNPLRNNQIEEFAPCGVVAGTIARIDAEHGIWKAPAGIEAGLAGVVGLTAPLTDAENGQLNPLGINCLRSMPAAGPVIWGARTLKGSDQLASEWKYIPVRRLASYIEESLYRGMQWAVFEPNDEPLWRQIVLNINSFMNVLFRQGAFQGSTAKDAYFVKCDKDTTTQDDIDNGIVNVLVGFAPLKPAEFVVIKLQQIAGQPQT